MAAINCGGIGFTGAVICEGVMAGNAEEDGGGTAPPVGAVPVSSERTTRLRAGMMSELARANRCV